eukprot:1156598-Pelagomonas_calceolata.AAC.4
MEGPAAHTARATRSGTGTRGPREAAEPRLVLMPCSLHGRVHAYLLRAASAGKGRRDSGEAAEPRLVFMPCKLCFMCMNVSDLSADALQRVLFRSL